MNKIYVGNLPFNTVEAELVDRFRQFGEIKEVALIRDRYSNDFKGFGFITYADQQAAESAISMDGQDFSGRPMKVSIAREPEKRTGGGGGFRRSGGGAGAGAGARRSNGGGEGRGRFR